MFFWDKQIFVLVGNVVQAVGRTAKKLKDPTKPTTKALGTEQAHYASLPKDANL